MECGRYNGDVPCTVYVQERDGGMGRSGNVSRRNVVETSKRDSKLSRLLRGLQTQNTTRQSTVPVKAKWNETKRTSAFKCAIKSLRSLSFFKPAKAILVPGMYFFGFSRYSNSVVSSQVMPLLMFAAVYENPSAWPVLRPKMLRVGGECYRAMEQVSRGNLPKQVGADFVGATLFEGVALSTTGLEETSTFLSVTCKANTSTSRVSLCALPARPCSQALTVRHIYCLVLKSKEQEKEARRMCATTATRGCKFKVECTKKVASGSYERKVLPALPES